MEKFVVSARKYRPQNFDTVVGQSHITTTLKNAIKSDHLAHAFLFCGPRGVGKTTCARILAKTINCTNRTAEGEACNECESCRSFDAGTSLNIHELDAASNNSVDDIRSLVEQVRFAPQAGKYKVYIVDEVHMLSASAFNAFLKTLEEPPSYAIFILATTEKHKILPTILSRCQIFDFKRITPDDTVNFLNSIAEKEHFTAEKSALQVIALKSEGCMRDALSILDKIVSFTNGSLTYRNTLENLNILDDDYYFRLLASVQKKDLAEALLIYNEIDRKGFEGDLVLSGMMEFIRNILVCLDSRSAPLLDVVEGMQQRYRNAATESEPAFLIGALNILSEASQQYKSARNKRLLLEMTLIRLNYLIDAISISFQQGELVKKKMTDKGSLAFRISNVRLIAGQSLKSPALPKVTPKQVENPTQGARLHIADGLDTTQSSYVNTLGSAEAEAHKVQTRKMPSSAVSHPKKNLLDSLREKADEVIRQKNEIDVRPLEMSELKDCWMRYADLLEKEEKHSAAITFRKAVLSREENTLFSVSVPTLLAQKFVEQERGRLGEWICKQFSNPGITFSVLVCDDGTDSEQETVSLNSRQKFEVMANEFPLLRELKEKLNLDIDF